MRESNLKNKGVFNPDMLVIAREFRGLSQSALSNKTSITQGRISKIENGLLSPDDETLSKIADVLNFRSIFFYSHGRALGQPISAHPMYRKRSSVGVKALNRLSAELSIRIHDLKKFLRAVDIEPTFPLPEYDIEDYEGDAETIADMVRKAWSIRIGPIQNLTMLAEKSGIVVFWSDFQYAKIDGVAVNIPGNPPCVFLNQECPADRMRFSLAHEIGHIIMHRQPSSTMEDEANRFAAELLMPRDEIRKEFRGRITLAKLAQLKRVWRVSMQALLFRAKQLDLISENQSSYLWRQLSSLGYRKKEPISTEFSREKPRTFSDIIDLHRNSLGYTIVQLSEITPFYEEDFINFYRSEIMGEQKLRLVK